MDETWQPLDAKDGEIDYGALYDEVTEWLEPSLLQWIEDVISEVGQSVVPSLDISLIRSMERTLRVPLSHVEGSRAQTARRLLQEFRDYGREWVMVDYLVSLGRFKSAARALEMLLVESGSAWTVGTRAGRPALVQRVPEGVRDFIDHVVEERGGAGRRLAEAFAQAYGVNPNSSQAYSYAVKAVEDAAKPVVSPNNDAATLGTMIAQIRDSGKFKLPHTRQHSDSPTHDVLLGMMRMLWVGQHDRHGGDPSAPPVSQDEAETAVMVAATLVELFSSGKVVK